MPRHTGPRLTGFHAKLDANVSVAWVEEPYLEVRCESLETAKKCIDLLIKSRGKSVEWNDYDAALAAEARAKRAAYPEVPASRTVLEVIGRGLGLVEEEEDEPCDA